ncbi:MAG: zinc-dependent peptidase [Gammaproteobacteria bacterium]|nr:zinc-dependent peptidase [Gammaproteobacteria bacterium]MBU1414008.1 zinc-dependent peptidase [Gammaproteobacteria bacterium]
MGLLRNWWKRVTLDRVRVSDDEWNAAEAHLPFLGHLDAAERRRLRAMAHEFLAEKEWSAGPGLTLTPDIQLSISLQACLPVLNLGLERYRGWVGIIIYPGDFVIPRNFIDDAGVVHEYDDAVLGEAWEGGPVLVSWFDDPKDADGVNVVLHEFAHKLDMENGTADGLPRLPADMSRHDWLAAFEPAYENFCTRVDSDEDTRLDPYAAEHLAEFFAVMSEAFFETPDVLHDEYPAVYEQLRRFYRQDPLQRAG